MALGRSGNVLVQGGRESVLMFPNSKQVHVCPKEGTVRTALVIAKISLRVLVDGELRAREVLSVPIEHIFCAFRQFNFGPRVVCTGPRKPCSQLNKT